MPRAAREIGRTRAKQVLRCFASYRVRSSLLAICALISKNELKGSKETLINRDYHASHATPDGGLPLLFRFSYFNNVAFFGVDDFLARLPPFLKKLPTGHRFAVDTVPL